MLKRSQGFSFSDVDGDQLVAFYGMEFAAAVSDGSVDPEELQTIYQLMDLSSLTPAQKATVHGYATDPPAVNECLAVLADAPPELRFAVAVGLIEIIAADGIVTDDEEYFLQNSLRILRVSAVQREMIEDFIWITYEVAAAGVDDGQAEHMIEDAVMGLKAVDVPVASVHLSGAVVALDEAGINSGMNALGLGKGSLKKAGGSLMEGVGMFMASREQRAEKRRKRREGRQQERLRKNQHMVENLQGSIDGMLHRIDEIKARAAEQGMNEAEVRELQRRLRQLAQLMQQKGGAF